MFKNFLQYIKSSSLKFFDILLTYIYDIYFVLFDLKVFSYKIYESKTNPGFLTIMIDPLIFPINLYLQKPVEDLSSKIIIDLSKKNLNFFNAIAIIEFLSPEDNDLVYTRTFSSKNIYDIFSFNMYIKELFCRIKEILEIDYKGSQLKQITIRVNKIQK